MERGYESGGLCLCQPSDSQKRAVFGETARFSTDETPFSSIFSQANC